MEAIAIEVEAIATRVEARLSPPFFGASDQAKPQKVHQVWGGRKLYGEVGVSWCILGSSPLPKTYPSSVQCVIPKHCKMNQTNWRQTDLLHRRGSPGKITESGKWMNMDLTN